MVALRTIIMGAGAAGAAATALVTQPFFRDAPAPDRPEPAGMELCLKTDLVLFDGVAAGCYARDDLLALADAPVAGSEGAPAAVTMTHPTDASIAQRECLTCRDYRDMLFDGWYAATARDMRREGYFIRACGVLAALTDAAPAERSFFTDGGLTAEEATDLAGVFSFGEAVTAENMTVRQSAPHQWRVTADAFSVTLFELANADFDNDGVEEMLVFTAGAAEGGTARFYDAGLVDKPSSGAAPSFTPISLTREAGAGPAG